MRVAVEAFPAANDGDSQNTDGESLRFHTRFEEAPENLRGLKRISETREWTRHCAEGDYGVERNLVVVSTFAGS